MIEKQFICNDYDTALRLFGVANAHLDIISRILNVEYASNGLAASFKGTPENVARSVEILSQLSQIISSGGILSKKDIRLASEAYKNNKTPDIKTFYRQTLLTNEKGEKISPKTANQAVYVKAIMNNTLTFGVGPAGTGKTYLAIAVAASLYKKKQISRIILTRPAVEAGEKLGFLPGDLEEKVNPYLTPLFDALFEMLGAATVSDLIDNKIIEIAPLAFMRGRTLKNAFVILDEAQNTTSEQMKMFLTRLGQNTRYVVTGDISQIDLPEHKKSGMVEAIKILRDIKDIAITYFKSEDVIRHPLVRDIINAYEKHTDL